MQEGLFINKPVYDFQSLDALLVHAYYTTKHLTAATEIGYNSAFYVQVCAAHLGLQSSSAPSLPQTLQSLMISPVVSRPALCACCDTTRCHWPYSDPHVGCLLPF